MSTLLNSLTSKIYSGLRLTMRGTLMAVWSLSALQQTPAEVVLDNLATAGSNANFGFLNLGQGQAIRFGTGNGQYSLDSVTIRIAGDSFFSLIEPRSASVSLRLYEDVAGQPGGLLTDFSTKTLVGSNVVQETFQPSQQLVLSPHNTYWIAMLKEAQSANTRTTWYSGNITGGTIFTDSATGWQLYHGAIGTRDNGVTWSGPSSFEGAIQIVASPVPEPTIAALLAAGTLLLINRRRPPLSC